jgi:hypothetical protein
LIWQGAFPLTVYWSFRSKLKLIFSNICYMLHKNWPVTILKRYKYGDLYYIIFCCPSPPRVHFPIFYLRIFTYYYYYYYYYYYFKTLLFCRERCNTFDWNMDELRSKMFRFQILTLFSPSNGTCALGADSRNASD